VQNTVVLGVSLGVVIWHIAAIRHIYGIAVLEVVQDERPLGAWLLVDVLLDHRSGSLVMRILLCSGRSTFTCLSSLTVVANVSGMTLIVHNVLGLNIHVGSTHIISKPTATWLSIGHLMLRIDWHLVSIWFDV
jgi:hypothetical protein